MCECVCVYVRCKKISLHTDAVALARKPGEAGRFFVLVVLFCMLRTTSPWGPVSLVYAREGRRRRWMPNKLYATGQSGQTGGRARA